MKEGLKQFVKEVNPAHDLDCIHNHEHESNPIIDSTVLMLKSMTRGAIIGLTVGLIAFPDDTHKIIGMTLLGSLTDSTQVGVRIYRIVEKKLK